MPKRSGCLLLLFAGCATSATKETTTPTSAPPPPALVAPSEPAVPVVHTIEPAWISKAPEGKNTSKSAFMNTDHAVADSLGRLYFGGKCYQGTLTPAPGMQLNCGGFGQPAVLAYNTDGSLRWAWSAKYAGTHGNIKRMAFSQGPTPTLLVAGVYEGAWGPLGKRLPASQELTGFLLAIDATTGVATWMRTFEPAAVTADAEHVYALRATGTEWAIEQRSLVDGSLTRRTSVPSCTSCLAWTVAAVGRPGGGATFVIPHPKQSQLGIVHVGATGVVSPERRISLATAPDEYGRLQALLLDDGRLVVNAWINNRSSSLVIIDTDDAKALEKTYDDNFALAGTIGTKLLVVAERYGSVGTGHPMFGAPPPPLDEIEGRSAVAAIDLATGNATDLWVPPNRSVEAVVGAAGLVAYRSKPGIVGLRIEP